MPGMIGESVQDSTGRVPAGKLVLVPHDGGAGSLLLLARRFSFGSLKGKDLGYPHTKNCVIFNMT
jgi:hypothetical protein